MIPDLKRGGAVVILTLTSITAGAHAAWGQDQARLSSIQGTLGPVNLQFQAASQPPRPFYETRAIHDPNQTARRASAPRRATSLKNENGFVR
jgi:hypothetical protein